MHKFVVDFELWVISLFILFLGAQFRAWRYCWFPLAIFCVIVPIEWWYDWSFMRHYDNEISAVKFEWKDARQDTHVALKETNARMIIETVEFLRAIAVVWVACISVYVITQWWSCASLWQWLLLILFGCAAVVLYGVLWEGILPSIPNPWTSHTLFDELSRYVNKHSGRPDFGQLIWQPVVKASHFTLILAALATGLIMARPAERIPELQHQMKCLAHLLFACAALCVIHVIGMGMWYIRPAALLGNPADSELLSRLSATISVVNAVSYMVILIAFHLPAVEVLTSGARPQAPKEWLEKNDIYPTLTRFYVHIAAILSPLIAGFPLSKLLGSLFG
jgi:hypothetical protein